MELRNQEKQSIQTFIQNFPSKETQRAYSRDIEDFVLNCQVSLTSCEVQDFLNYRDKLRKKYSDNTVNRKMASVKSLVNWLTLNGVLDKNPISAIKALKCQPENPTEAFSDEEAKSLLEAAENDQHLLILKLLLVYGLRRSEVSRVSVKDLRRGRTNTTIRVKSKGGKVREFPINNELDKLLNLVGEVNMSPDGIYKLIRRYCDRLGIAHKTPHSCRATMISHLLEKGVPVRDVADAAGHSSVVTTMIYDKKRKGLEDCAVSKVSYE